MGWTGITIDKSEVKDYIRGLWTATEEDRNRFEVVSQISYGNTYYQAVRNKEDNTVFANVVLTSYEDGELIYKDIHENMGPGSYTGVSQKFLSLLSETDNEYAKNWRKGVEKQIKRTKWIKKNLVSSSTVTFNSPLHYAGNEPATEFKLYNVALKGMHVKLNNGMWGSLPKGWKDMIVAIDGKQVPEA